MVSNKQKKFNLGVFTSAYTSALLVFKNNEGLPWWSSG